MLFFILKAIISMSAKGFISKKTNTKLDKLLFWAQIRASTTLQYDRALVSLLHLKISMELHR